MSAVAMKTQTKQLIDTLSEREVSLVFDYINSFIKQQNEQIVSTKKDRALKELFSICKENTVDISLNGAIETAKAVMRKYESLN